MALLLMVCMLLSIPGNTILASQGTETVENVSEDAETTEKLKSKRENIADRELIAVDGDVKAATTSSNISVNTSYTGQLLE